MERETGALTLPKSLLSVGLHARMGQMEKWTLTVLLIRLLQILGVMQRE